MERLSIIILILLVGTGLLVAGDGKVDFELDASRTHSMFSSKIEPILRVPSGSVIRAQTREASDGQFTPESTVEAMATLDFLGSILSPGQFM